MARAPSGMGQVISAIGGSIAAHTIGAVNTYITESAVQKQARVLAQRVLATEQRTWRRLIGDDVKRIDLRYVLEPAPGRSAGAEAAGRLFGAPDIAGYYRRTPGRRLVITGEPGVGKTVLAIELILALIKPPEPGRPRTPDEPVPVRLSLSQWDPEAGPEQNLVDHLVRTYRMRRRRARELVEQRRVLPVLDGLDEMDAVRPNGAPDPDAPRARAVLAALNTYQDGLQAAPLIITCRTAHYTKLVKSAAGRGLRDAARIDITPVSPDDAQAYLEARANDRSRWRPVTDALRDDPRGVLARTLSTPWRLCLTATVYFEDGDPAEMLRYRSPARLDQHLIACYIPAATRLCPRRGYTPERIHRWLHHLTAAGADARKSTVDLFLEKLWPLAGTDRARDADLRLAAVYCALWVLPNMPFQASRPPIVYLQMPFLLISMVAVLAGSARKELRQNSTRWRHLNVVTRRRRATAFLAVIVLLGVADALIKGTVLGSPARGVLIGVVTTFAFWLLFWVWLAPVWHLLPTAARPGDLITDDLVTHLAVVFAGWSMVVLLTFGEARGLTTYLVLFAYVCVTSFRFFGGSPGRRYLAFLLISRRERKLPLRLKAFLDWACEAGIMRLSGTAYQFRHLELQQWVAKREAPLPDSAPPRH